MSQRTVTVASSQKIQTLDAQPSEKLTFVRCKFFPVNVPFLEQAEGFPQQLTGQQNVTLGDFMHANGIPDHKIRNFMPRECPGLMLLFLHISSASIQQKSAHDVGLICALPIHRVQTHEIQISSPPMEFNAYEVQICLKLLEISYFPIFRLCHRSNLFGLVTELRPKVCHRSFLACCRFKFCKFRASLSIQLHLCFVFSVRRLESFACVSADWVINSFWLLKSFARVLSELTSVIQA